jgi:hypothetical protein
MYYHLKINLDLIFFFFLENSTLKKIIFTNHFLKNKIYFFKKKIKFFFFEILFYLFTIPSLSLTVFFSTFILLPVEGSTNSFCFFFFFFFN